MQEQVQPGVIRIDAARRPLEPLAAEGEAPPEQCRRRLRQAGARIVLGDGLAVAGQLVPGHLVVATGHHQPRRRDLHVQAVAGPDHRAGMGLVRRLVRAEPDVAVGAEELGRPELGLQVGQQREHRTPHRKLVHLPMVGPVRLGVVRLQTFVEQQGLLGEAGERSAVLRLAHARHATPDGNAGRLPDAEAGRRSAGRIHHGRSRRGCPRHTPVQRGWQSWAVQRWFDLEEVPAGFGPSAVTIGNFDGVHRGHQAVLGRLVEQSRRDRRQRGGGHLRPAPDRRALPGPGTAAAHRRCRSSWTGAGRPPAWTRCW